MTTRDYARAVRRNRRASWRCLPPAIETLESRSLLTAATCMPAAGPPAFTVDGEQYESSSVLVRFRDDPGAAGEGFGTYVTSAGMVVSTSRAGYQLVPGMQRVELAESVSVEEALAAFRADPNVLYAEPNFQVGLTLAPNDAYVGDLWGMNNTGQTGGTPDADIDAFEAWDIATGTGSTIVAVIDTGVDYTHPDLAANIWVNPGEIPGDGIDNDSNGYVDDVHGYDFANNDADPMDDHNHGTHVAGTIGAVGNNATGVTGVNWNATIMPVKFLTATGSGRISDAIEAIEYAVANGAQISNNSWGFNGAFSQPLYDAIESARDAGHIFVAAAGNGDAFGNGLNNDAVPFWPSNSDLDNVVAVAATDHNDALATFSNYGQTTVDVGAPGVGILSTTISNSYDTFSGTSMATPHVAGLLSLIFDQNPSWGYPQVIDRLYETVEPIAALDGRTVTGGRINAALALGPDLTGPRAVATDPSNYLFDPFDALTIRFSEAVDPASFTPADVISLTGPGSAIAVDNVAPVSGSFNRAFRLSFAEQDHLGDYSLVLGPGLTDLAGNAMDQDGDGNGGESIDDRFSTSFSLVPFFLNLDFGTDGSPVQSGNFVPMLDSTGYSAGRGYGWTSGTIGSRDRGSAYGGDLVRDFNFTASAELAVDVPQEPAVYEVKVTMGDGLAARDEMGISLEGLLFDSVDTAANEYAVVTHRVTVADGQLNINLTDLGGDDGTLVVNGIEINAIGPDLSGPAVVATTPSSQAEGALDRVVVTFGEAVDAATFTTADVVSLAGPQGPIPVTAVNQLGPVGFEITFPTQTAVGNYTLTIGPDIADVAGNLMNQDGDTMNGEVSDDRFTKSLQLVPVPPFDASFDFGTSTSPVAAGTTQVSNLTAYSATMGYGWTAGSIDSRDRGTSAGTELTRDFNFTENGTFAVDVPAATAVYDVTVTLGDALAVRDDMGVIIEGILVDTIDTPAGDYVTKTYRVTVADGQLTLTLEDLGGVNADVMINGLDVREVGPDTSGARVIASSPTNETTGSIDRVELTFDEAIDPATFTTADVVNLAGPGGAIAATAVVQTAPNVFEVRFATQTELGDYSLTIGPGVADLAGNQMNQDGDATNGEAGDDRFSTTIELAATPAFEAHFDFGTASSPLAAGAARIAHGTSYSPALGHGWVSGSINSRDRGSAYGNDLERDFNFTSQGTFLVDVPSTPTVYDVTVTMGDGLSLRDEMGVSIEGILFDSLTSAAGQYATGTYRVTVTDGQLTVEVEDLGGANSLAMINGLDVVEVGPDTAGPQVVAVNPAAEITGSLESIELTFSEEVDAATLTTDDVVSLTGPNGAIAPGGVVKIAPNVFAVTFAPQTALGDYTLTLGPDLTDVVGNRMNQDGDSTNGEAGDDRFSATIAVVATPPFEQHYDFGTASSPVATGATRVVHTTSYSAAQGFGWTSGSINSRDRGASHGNDVERDFNFTSLGTFVVDVPVGTAEYDVTVTLGDGLALRDDMGVFLEGALFGSLSAPAGQYATATYRVTVSDGQLTLLLDDLGGSNSLVMINGLDIVEVQAGASGFPFHPPGRRIEEPSRAKPSFAATDAAVVFRSSVELLRPLVIERNNDSTDDRSRDDDRRLVIPTAVPVWSTTPSDRFNDEDDRDAAVAQVNAGADLEPSRVDRLFEADEKALGESLLDALLLV